MQALNLALRICEAHLGRDHPDTAATLVGLVLPSARRD
jgi:hypothetical protein